MSKSYSNNTPKIVGGLTIGFISLIAIYLFIVQPLSQDDSPTSGSVSIVQDESTRQPTDTNSESISAADPEISSEQAYADGGYEASAIYELPKNHSNEITVAVSLENDKITSVTVDNVYSENESLKYISGFENAIEEAVVGEKIEALSLSQVGGASLTTEGFNAAIGSIARSAQN